MSRRVVLGITGGVAAYKSVELASRLRQLDHAVDAVLTPAAERFVGALSFAAVTGRRAYTDQDFHAAHGEVIHVELAATAELLVVCPASADFIARLSIGMADTLLAAVALSTAARKVICPAMESGMWTHPATQANIARLRAYGWAVIEPESGHLASGRSGVGRLPDPGRIAEEISGLFGADRLRGRSVLVTAGPTREHIDPVRFISNPSTGRMGIAVAEAARDAGARVTLVLGPTELRPPAGVETIRVVSAQDMFEAVRGRFPDADALIATAAVADQTPRAPRTEKLRKAELGTSIEVVQTEDILAWAGRSRRPGQVLVGFAAQTGAPLDEARRKLREKGCDLVVGNDVAEPGAGFGVDTNRCIFVGPEFERAVGPASKRRIGEEIVAFVAERL